MNQDCVVAVYADFEKATEGVRALEAGGHPEDQVSFVTHRVEDSLPDNTSVEDGDEAETRATTGAVAGGLLGALLGAPLIAVPGVGPILAFGPLATGATGAIVGGFLGSMAGYGVHDDHVKSYQEMVKDGKALIVATGTPDQVATAKETLQKTNPETLNLHAKNSADSEEISKL